MNESEFEEIQSQRLPTLHEVLIQKTDAPVDLWAFYTFLSQFPYAINYLEFWIDLMAHIRLCKDYIRGIRDSVILPNEHSQEYDADGNLIQDKEAKHENANDASHDNEYGDNASVTSSVLINALMDEGYLDFQNPERVNEFLQGNINYSPQLSQMIRDWQQNTSSVVDDSVDDDEIRNDSGNKVISVIDQLLETHGANDKPQITAKQLYSNAMQICSLYLISPERSEKYLINIPEHIREKTVRMVQYDKRNDPEVFEDLKNISYQFLEIDCFSKFLGRVALHNLHDQISDWRFHSSAALAPGTNEKSKRTINRHHSKSPFSSYTTLSRITLGMLWLGIGFWIGYVLIFLDYARGIRVVTIVPFLIGSYFIVCGFYQLDILYSFSGITQELMYKHKSGTDQEATTLADGKDKDNISGIFKLLGGKSRIVKVRHKFIRKLLLKRGLWCLLYVLAITGVFTVIFSCVPSTRV